MEIIRKNKKSVSTFLLLVFANTFFAPSAYAGQGDTQVEHKPFNGGNSVNMVNGQFNYSIPLMNLGGYPINLSYNSGNVKMQTEASDVGLGWSLSVGSISRSVVGVPDDFKGDEIRYNSHIKPYQSISVDLTEWTKDKHKENAGLQTDNPTESKVSTYLTRVYWNNYKGVGFSLGFSNVFGKDNVLNPSYDSQSGYGINYFDKYFGALNANWSLREGFQGLSISGKYAGQFSFSKGAIPSVGFPIVTETVNSRVALGEVDGPVGFNESKFTLFDVTRTTSEIATPKYKREGYGFLYQNEGVIKEAQGKEVVKDYIRQNLPYKKNAPFLPASMLGKDMFFQSDNGSGGSFQLESNSIMKWSTSPRNAEIVNKDRALEVGVDKTISNFHVGGDYTSVTGDQKNGVINFTDDELANSPISTSSLYFKKNNEINTENEASVLATYDGERPINLKIKKEGKILANKRSFHIKNSYENGDVSASSPNYHGDEQKAKRQSYIQYFTTEEAKDFGYTRNTDYYLTSESSKFNRRNHIAEINVYETNGDRYTYGHPVYNVTRTDAVFSLDKDAAVDHMTLETDIPSSNTSGSGITGDLIAGKSADQLGSELLDVTTTPEYATSWLISSITSDDYIDVTNDGPSDDDYGTYVEFEYDYNNKVDNHGWRTPHIGVDVIQGAKGVKNDDIGVYSKGEKELLQIKSIETRTHKAIFIYNKDYPSDTHDRQDGASSSTNNNGGIDNSNKMRRLQEIHLFVKRQDQGGNIDINHPIQVTYFNYGYDLCRNYPGNSNASVNTSSPNYAESGKLTLKEVYSRHYNSNAGEDYRYKFDYHENNPDENPDYNRKNLDRWGEYKEVQNDGNSSYKYGNDYPYVDFRYANQQENSNSPESKAPWLLKGIVLPNGSSMDIEYEQNDYAYSENRHAMQMMDIVSTDDAINFSRWEANSNRAVALDLSNDEDIQGFKRHLVVKLPSDGLANKTSAQQSKYFYEKYLQGIENSIYIKAYTRLGYYGDNPTPKKSDFDYVETVAEIDTENANPYYVLENGSNYYGVIKLKGEFSAGIVPFKLNPIRKAAFEHVKEKRHEFLYGLPSIAVPDPVSMTKNMMKDLLDITGPSSRMEVDQLGKGIKCNGWSVVRFKNPSGYKKGGGYRVKSVRVNDNWQNSAVNPDSYTYEQTYDYTTQDFHGNENRTISSGVAYEPQFGKEENGNTEFIEYEEEIGFFEDNHHLTVGHPLDLHMPGPSVVYSKVTVKTGYPNVPNGETITRSIAPHSVYEYYTGKDFPVIKNHTTILKKKLPVIGGYVDPVGLSVQQNYDNALSQGYSIILNDMNGRMKKTSELTRDNKFISSQNYIYHTSTSNSKVRVGGLSGLELEIPFDTPENTAPLLASDQSMENGEIGVDYDIWFDMFESSQNIRGTSGLKGNIGLMLNFPFIKYLMPLPNLPYIDIKSSEKQVVVNKVIRRSGIIKEVVTKKEQSEIKSEYLAYDKETGSLLLSRIEDEHKDHIYKLSHPGHWEYPRFNGKYENQDYENAGPLTYGSSGYYLQGANSILKDGDYVKYEDEFSQVYFAYIILRGNNEFEVRDLDNRSNYFVTTMYNLRVLNSANTNYSRMMVGEEAARSSNFYWNVIDNCPLYLTKHINASAITYKPDWNSQCCMEGLVPNPFHNRSLNAWRPYQNFVLNQKRGYDKVTRIQKTGLIENYQKFNWQNIGNDRWIITSTAIKYGQNGNLKEQSNALGLYSSSFYGYGGDAVVSFTQNSGFKESIFDGFESYEYEECRNDGDLNAEEEVANSGSGSITTEKAHTGKFSLKIEQGKALEIETIIIDCNE